MAVKLTYYFTAFPAMPPERWTAARHNSFLHSTNEATNKSVLLLSSNYINDSFLGSISVV